MASVSKSDNKTEHVSERIQNCQRWAWIQQFRFHFYFVLFFSCFFFFYRLCVYVCQLCLFSKISCRPRKWRTQHCMQSNGEMAPQKKKERGNRRNKPMQTAELARFVHMLMPQHKQIRKSSGDTQSIYYFRLDCLTTQYKTIVANTDIQTQTTTIIICASFFYRQHINIHIIERLSCFLLIFAICFCLDGFGISISLTRMLKSFMFRFN